MNSRESFDSLMAGAQMMHGRGEFQTARDMYLACVAIAPDYGDKARAIRGDAASAYRLGEVDVALHRSQHALDIHAGLVHNTQQPDLALRREFAQSLSVAGRIIVREAAIAELGGTTTITGARRNALDGVAHLRQAADQIQVVETVGGAPDQYGINIFSHTGAAVALYSTRGDAQSYARLAVQRSRLSESAAVANAAKLSTRARLEAKTRAVVRAHAAQTIVRLASPGHSAGRTIALKLATHKKTGF